MKLTPRSAQQSGMLWCQRGMQRRQFLGMLAPLLPLSSAAAQTVQRDVPYVPSPEEIVEAMLKLADIKKTDVLYDLGCGDGRIVITAAKNFGARGVGIDIDPERIKEATENARKAGVTDRVQFRQGNLFQADIKEATAVTLYLLPDVNRKLKPKLMSDLKPGVRVVSHQFDMGDWTPEKKMDLGYRTIYLWTIPAKTASR